ncbi:hypothetical protein LLG96_17620, partial [bacterium]|nr:hypothetical protein [bacterium]
MTYLAGLIAVSVIIFTIRKYGNRIPVIPPLRNLGFFKFHYMLSGVALAFIFPDDFMPLFEPVRITVLIFCLGWIGLYYGCGLELRAHQRFSSR